MAIDGVSKLGDLVGDALVVGEPVTGNGFEVYPVFSREPVLEYLTLTRARPAGVTVRELAGSGSVRDLVVENPTDRPVLLFEGEEVLGAQQNRTFDSSVLVPARSELTVHVSCVEAGRWEGGRNAEPLHPAEQTAYPEMRREKARQATRAREAGMEARADQHVVWSLVADRSDELASHSATSSINDVFESRRSELRSMASGVPLQEGQVGAIVRIGAQIRAFDLVSRPEAFADLHGPLVQGYCLDALAETTRRAETENPREEPEAADRITDVDTFVERVLGTTVHQHEGLGLGRDFRFESEALVGTGLTEGEELIQLSVFDGQRGSGKVR